MLPPRPRINRITSLSLVDSYFLGMENRNPLFTEDEIVYKDMRGGNWVCLFLAGNGVFAVKTYFDFPFLKKMLSCAVVSIASGSKRNKSQTTCFIAVGLGGYKTNNNYFKMQ